MRLTPKQKAFADYYIESGNVTESAKRAGYKQPHVQGSQTLENLRVQEYINEHMKNINSKRIMDATEALELLTSIARGEMEETVVTPSGMSVTRNADITQRQRALESILKRYPMNKHDELKEKLLETQIEKLKVEIDRIQNNDDKQQEKDVAEALRGLVDGINSKTN